MAAKKTTKKATSGKRAPAKKAPAKPASAKKTTPKKKPAKASEKKMSAINAAAKVLSESKETLSTKDMIERMATKGYWSSPGGKTPHATLYSAILRDIQKNGDTSRFQKVERGKFASR